MEFRVHDREDYENIIKFLKLEKEYDEHNCKEMLDIEPSHLTKGKITEMGKLAGRYKKESDRLINGYKEFNDSKESKVFLKRYGYLHSALEEKRAWLKRIRKFDLENIKSFSKKEIEDIVENYMKGKQLWFTI